MSLGDVFAIFGFLLTLGITLPGLLLAWTLIFPNLVERTRLRLQNKPWFCLGMGVLLASPSLIGLIIFFNSPNPLGTILGWLGLLSLLTLISIGTAGLATLMGQRLSGYGMPRSRSGGIVGGAIALELAAVFPLIGWFIIIPLVILTTLGAVASAIIQRKPQLQRPISPVEVANVAKTS